MSAPRTEELRQRYDAAREAMRDFAPGDHPSDYREAQEDAIEAADEMREALAVLEEQNKMWQETNEFARMESESQSRVAGLRERVRLLEAQAEEARKLAEGWWRTALHLHRNDGNDLAVRDMIANPLPWEASVSGSSLAPQKEETK